MQVIDDIVGRKNQYEFERRVDTMEDVYVETQWQDHSPLEDERAQGYSFARTRIIITARPRNRSPGNLQSFSVTFRAECLVRTETGDWVVVPMTAMRKSHLRGIADEVKADIVTGIRSI